MGTRELSEGQLATVADGMGFVTRIGNNLERLQAHLEQCRVPLPADSFRHISRHLSIIHDRLTLAGLEHCDAVDEKKGGRK